MIEKIRNSFDSHVKIEQTIVLIGRVNGIAIKSETHQNSFDP